MQIKEVEEKTGITSHNIRYYEKENLIKPQRNPLNGYREYTQDDVMLINQIKFLRMLEIPIKSVRKCLEGECTLKDVVQDNLIDLQQEEKRMKENQILCEQILSSQIELSSLSEEWIEEVWVDKETYIIKVDQIRKEDRRKARNFYMNQIIAILGWLCTMIITILFTLNVISSYVSRTVLIIDIVLILLLFAFIFYMVWKNEKYR